MRAGAKYHTNAGAGLAAQHTVPICVVQYARHYPCDTPRIYTVLWPAVHFDCDKTALLQTQPPHMAAPASPVHGGSPRPWGGPAAEAAYTQDEDEDDVCLDGSRRFHRPPTAPSWAPSPLSEAAPPTQPLPQARALDALLAQLTLITTSHIDLRVASKSAQRAFTPLQAPCVPLSLPCEQQWSCVLALHDIIKDFTAQFDTL